MKKKLFVFLINFGIFWIVLDLWPGLNCPYGPISRFYGALGFAFVMMFSESIRPFLGLPKVFITKLLVGTLLTFGGLWFMNNFGTNFFSFGESYIGGGNFIFFSVPKILVLQDTNLVLLFAAFIGNICSIIVFKLKR
jgi:hypothetical protein